MASRPAEEQHLRGLAQLRRVRDRIDREYAQPLDVEALARDANMSALQHPLHRAGWRAAQPLSGPDSSLAGGVAVMHGEAGHQTGQESRSTRGHAAPTVTVMDISIHSSFLPHDDPEASLAFYRDTLDFEVRLDVGKGKMR